MRAFALIQTLTTGEAGYWGSPKRSFHRSFARWLNRHGAALGCLVVVLTFIGAVDLVRHVLTFL